MPEVSKAAIIVGLECTRISYKQACEYLGVSRSTLHRLINSGCLKPVRPDGHQPHFTEEILLGYVNGNHG
jgi:excisionase family DNA binding protein